MLTPKQLKNYDFQFVARNAYKATDVDTFMEEVYKSYEQMFRENAELIKKLNLLADKISHYKAEEESIRNAMVEAQKLKESIVSEAERIATEKITSATEQAQAKTNAAVERSLTLAKENAAKLMRRAQELYEQQVTSIVEETKAEKKKLQEVKAEAVSVRKKLLDTYQMQLELLQMAPDYQDEVDDSDLEAFAEAARAEAEEMPEINVTFADVQQEEVVDPVDEDDLEDVPEAEEVPVEEIVAEEVEEEPAEEAFSEPAKKPVRRFFFDLKTKEAPAEPEDADDVSDINDYLDDEED